MDDLVEIWKEYIEKGLPRQMATWAAQGVIPAGAHAGKVGNRIAAHKTGRLVGKYKSIDPWESGANATAGNLRNSGRQYRALSR